MIRNQNGGMKNETHEIIKRSTVRETPMAAVRNPKIRDQKNRASKEKTNKQRKGRFEPVVTEDENGPKHGALSSPVDGPNKP